MIMDNYDDYFGGLTEEAYRKETEKHFKELELLCRDATPEEEQHIQENIDKISKSTRVNFWDLLEEHEIEALKEQAGKCWELYSMAFEYNMNDDTRTALSQMVTTYMPDIMQMFGYLIDKMEWSQVE